MARVALTLRGQDALIAPEDYLGKEFSAYLETVRKVGGFYVTAPKKGHTVPLTGVPSAIEAFRLAGFEPMLSADLKAAVLEAARADNARIDTAGDHVAEQREVLKARGLALRPFQEVGVQWLRSRRTALLGDDPGLGKTIQALMALPAGAPVIVICPAIAKGVWLRECRKWRPDLVPVVLKGKGSFQFAAPGQLLITNWDILPDEPEKVVEAKPAADLFEAGVQTLAKAAEGTVLIGDEFHAVKNSGTLRNQRFKALAKVILAAGGQVWGMTGTPLLNKPPDLWQLLTVLELAKDAFGTWPQFVRLFGGYSNGFGMEWGGKTSPEIPRMLRRVMLARKREEVLPELPPKTWQTEDVEIPAGMKVLLDKAAREAAEKGIDMDSPAVDLAKLQHLMFEQFSLIRAALAEAKIPALEDIVETFEENEEPVVVFSEHRAPVQHIGRRPGWAMITGDTPPAQRTQIEEAFQGGRLKGLACTIAAGGVAITLTRAHQCVFVDMNWTPSLNKQAEDRLCRFGQTRGVIVTRLVANHIMDSHVVNLLAEKQALLEATVEAARSQVPVSQEKRDLALVEQAGTYAPKTNGNGPRSDFCGGQASSNGSGGTNGATGRFRSPQGPLEEWAGKAMVRLARHDADRARDDNGVGFSKFDTDFGCKLADFYEEFGKLTDKQWACILKLAHKYRRQVGEPPAAAAPKEG